MGHEGPAQSAPKSQVWSVILSLLLDSLSRFPFASIFFVVWVADQRENELRIYSTSTKQYPGNRPRTTPSQVSKGRYSCRVPDCAGAWGTAWNCPVTTQRERAEGGHSRRMLPRVLLEHASSARRLGKGDWASWHRLHGAGRVHPRQLALYVI